MDLSQFHRPDFQQFVQDHLSEDPALLLFKYQGKTDFDLKTAVQQISARQKAKKKLPSWASNPQLVFPASISLEQSSSEETAIFKAKYLQGKTMIDLTGGFGVDSYFLNRAFEKAIYCEQQAELAEIAEHNLDLLAPKKFEIIKGDGIAFLEQTSKRFELIYADPARRGKGNQKLYQLEDCEPDVVSSWEMLKSKANSILLKVSPMLDISQAISALPDIQKVQVVSVKNEVKELLLHWQKQASEVPLRIEAIDLGVKETLFSFELGEEESSQSVYGEIREYLFEPLSGVLKAGAFKAFGSRFGLEKLEPNSHLYTSSELKPELPARVFKVIREVQPKKAEIKKLFPSGKVNVITRNYASGSEILKKKLGVKDGGEDFLIGTKTQSGFKVFWCKLVK
ncbi:class I SAM-dependent methyltransferase [Algoriphagus halophytocola]|uniref:Class I SAM-dependent methyltransferase n=1 Tax=Algoriphagus halophytocola TaxID=2991499 RepID=A0ABY6MF01_9BACT|nr:MULTISPECIES: class I SAM-dependent methyltransferase [unclassified Algoriphagus]UZD21211.1 class I SAM-dependent methyltransferase [Algoriphagus sp. TR-M5]WBL42421.1 class I SAM-dependent methyltransferase [Algoriphagus sp. TR-M9]